MSPRIIQHQGYDNHDAIPPNGTPRASSPTIQNLLQILSTGDLRSPIHLIQATSYRRKIAPLFADIHLYKATEKAVQSFRSDTALLLILLLYAFNHLSAPLSRLTPIEALPQAPTGLCPVPTRGFTP